MLSLTFFEFAQIDGDWMLIADIQNIIYDNASVEWKYVYLMQVDSVIWSFGQQQHYQSSIF